MCPQIIIRKLEKGEISRLKQLLSDSVRFSINAPYDLKGPKIRRMEDIMSSGELFTDSEVAKFIRKQNGIILMAHNEPDGAVGYAMLDPRPSQVIWPLVKSGIATRFISWQYGSPIRILNSGLKAKKTMRDGIPHVPQGFAEVSIGVLEQFTNLGIGSKLLSELETQAQQWGIHQIGALISSPNARSVAFFEKHGYSKSPKEFTFLDYKILVFTKELKP